MDYNSRKLVPYIPPAEYDKVAREFLEQFYPDALKNPPSQYIRRCPLLSALSVRFCRQRRLFLNSCPLSRPFLQSNLQCSS